MEIRFNYREASPEVFDLMLQQEAFLQSSGLPKKLYELIKIRASQINGCAFCIDMHSKALHTEGETLERIMLLSVWREAPVYTDKERAALELTEYVTRISEAGLPEEVYTRVRAQFNEKELVTLLMAINTINSWNRLGISTGMFPGCFL